MINFSQIDASLKHGKVISKKFITLLCFVLAVMIFMTLFLSALLIISLSYNTGIRLVNYINLIASDVTFGALSILYVIIIRHYRKLYKEIEIWLPSTVHLKAQSVIKDFFFQRIGFIKRKYVKIEITFQYNGKTINRESSVKAFGGREGGYDIVFSKYADREIDILYSPEYDQVLILKDSIK